MQSLADILLAPEHQPAVVDDCVALIEQQVASSGGLKGLALKTGLSMMKSRRPDILPRATNKFLPELAGALEPLYAEFRLVRHRDPGFGNFLQKHARRATDALLQAADRRVEASQNPGVKSTYARLRGRAQAEVLRAIPAIGGMLDRHLERSL